MSKIWVICSMGQQFLIHQRYGRRLRRALWTLGTWARVGTTTGAGIFPSRRPVAFAHRAKRGFTLSIVKCFNMRYFSTTMEYISSLKVFAKWGPCPNRVFSLYKNEQDLLHIYIVFFSIVDPDLFGSDDLDPEVWNEGKGRF